jgi:hypothetical protein
MYPYFPYFTPKEALESAGTAEDIVRKDEYAAEFLIRSLGAGFCVLGLTFVGLFGKWAVIVTRADPSFRQQLLEEPRLTLGAKTALISALFLITGYQLFTLRRLGLLSASIAVMVLNFPFGLTVFASIALGIPILLRLGRVVFGPHYRDVVVPRTPSRDPRSFIVALFFTGLSFGVLAINIPAIPSWFGWTH